VYAEYQSTAAYGDTALDECSHESLLYPQKPYCTPIYGLSESPVLATLSWCKRLGAVYVYVRIAQGPPLPQLHVARQMARPLAPFTVKPIELNRSYVNESGSKPILVSCVTRFRTHRTPPVSVTHGSDMRDIRTSETLTSNPILSATTQYLGQIHIFEELR
jgi:hypothetical protein